MKQRLFYIIDIAIVVLLIPGTISMFFFQPRMPGIPLGLLGLVALIFTLWRMRRKDKKV